MATDTSDFSAGMDDDKSAPVPKEELDCAKKWLKKIADAEEFDKHAREQYARDRRFARSAKGEFGVSVPVAASNIDVLIAFMYAKDPDVSVAPAPGTNPPPMDALLDMAREKIDADPVAQQQIQQAAMAAQKEAQQKAMAAGIGAALAGQPPPGAIAGQAPPAKPGQAPPPEPPPSPQEVAQHAANDTRTQMAQQQAATLMAPYKQRAGMAKQLAQTMGVILPQLWSQAKLKRECKKCVRSWLTVGIGWLKVTWQERAGTDPLMQAQLNDLTDNLARIEAQKKEVAEGESGELEAERAKLQLMIHGAQAKVEKMVARGLVIDFVAAEDITIPASVPTLEGYLQAPWIRHRTFMDFDDAQAAFKDIPEERLKKATKYRRKKRSLTTERDAVGPTAPVSSTEADQYESGTWATDNDGPTDFSLCVSEIWDKNSNMVYTVIEGMEGYARAPYAPNPCTTRFYPFFQVAPLQVDGERHPQSFIERSETLLMEMNRIPSAKRKHRIRAIPKTIFDSTGLDPAQVKKVEDGETGEMVGVRPTKPGEPVANMFAPISYPAIDPMLYDLQDIQAMLDGCWGTSEALRSQIQIAKTATEADIEDKGSDARTAFLRDAQDMMLDDLAEYTAQIAVQKLTLDDAKRFAGPFAFWPEKLTVEDLDSLVSVKIKAGSSGKPKTGADRAAWGVLAPMLQALIPQIAQLRGSPPDEVADCLEELAVESARRLGDVADVDSFMPQMPNTAPPVQLPPPGMPAPGMAALGGAPDLPGMPDPPGADMPPGAPPIEPGGIAAALASPSDPSAAPMSGPPTLQ